MEEPKQFHPEEWNRTQASSPGDALPFLAPQFIADAAPSLWLDSDCVAALVEAAGRFAANPAVRRLLWHAHVLLFASPGLDLHPTWELPGLGRDAGMFPLAALLSGLPRLREIHARRGIPADVSAATLADVGLWVRARRAATGRWGFAELGWLSWHFGGELYRLGRLQFLPNPFPDMVHVFRRRATGEVRLLSAAGRVYRADGQVDGTNGVHDEAGRWTACLTRDAGVIRGNQIAAEARAVREPVELPEAEWEEVLKPGDPILEIHIPAGEPMAEDACRASIARALQFYQRHVPERPFRAICCWAWLLDPALGALLPPDANIPRFQRMFHLYPVHAHESRVFERVFGDKRPDLTHAARSDRLRATITAFYDRGGRFAGEAGGVLRDHLAPPAVA